MFNVVRGVKLLKQNVNLYSGHNATINYIVNYNNNYNANYNVNYIVDNNFIQ